MGTRNTKTFILLTFHWFSHIRLLVSVYCTDKNVVRFFLLSQFFFCFTYEQSANLFTNISSVNVPWSGVICQCCCLQLGHIHFCVALVCFFSKWIQMWLKISTRCWCNSLVLNKKLYWILSESTFTLKKKCTNPIWYETLVLLPEGNANYVNDQLLLFRALDAVEK